MQDILYRVVARLKVIGFPIKEEEYPNLQIVIEDTYLYILTFCNISGIEDIEVKLTNIWVRMSAVNYLKAMLLKGAIGGSSDDGEGGGITPTITPSKLSVGDFSVEYGKSSSGGGGSAPQTNDLTGDIDKTIENITKELYNFRRFKWGS